MRCGTGIEYQVAAHLMYEGFLKEGLSIVKDLRERHDGLRRNPWDEPECEHHYVRAMASWSLLLALSGYSFNALKKSLGFNPRINSKNFRCFFSTNTGWGEFSQKIGQNSYIAKKNIGSVPKAYGNESAERQDLDRFRLQLFFKQGGTLS